MKLKCPMMHGRPVEVILHGEKDYRREPVVSDCIGRQCAAYTVKSKFPLHNGGDGRPTWWKCAMMPQENWHDVEAEQ